MEIKIKGVFKNFVSTRLSSIIILENFIVKKNSLKRRKLIVQKYFGCSLQTSSEIPNKSKNPFS